MENLIKTIKVGFYMVNKVEITGINTSELPRLSGVEQFELMKKIKQGDLVAREQFAICNMRLVLSVVQKFKFRIESYDDVFQVGCVGLMKAIDNFNTELNVKFSTYAVPMIIGEIRRFLRDNNSIKVSRSLRDIAFQVLKAREHLIKVNSREPSIDNISEYLDIPIRDVALAIEAISDPVSLCEPVYNDSDDTIYLMDQLKDEKNSEDDWLEKINLRDAFKKLSPREKKILQLRYFIGKTQMEVSDEIGISQAQVSRLEKNAINQIKENFAGT